MKLYKVIIFLFPFCGFSQSADSLITNFQKQHKSIHNLPCETGQLLTNRGMNLFVGERVAYYLADHENLSFCKNNVTLNTADGIFTMSHSLFEPSGADEPVKSYHVIGLKANIFNAFQAVANKTNFNNELGFTYKHFWVSKPKITLNNCEEKQIFDAKRAIILKNLAKEINEISQEFENTLLNMFELNSSQKKELKADFYKNIKEEYYRKFAEKQQRALFDSLQFKTMRSRWTNLNMYVPVMVQQFTTAPDFSTDFSTKKSYPAELSIGHTRFLETQKATKVYVNFRVGIKAYNSITSRMIPLTSLENYRSSGGKNATYLVDKQLDRAAIGRFKNFVTPTLKTQFIYFPPANHFGVSASLEQNFGKFKALNGTIGIPVVLIDKQSEALSNFEIQIHYFDITDTINPHRNLKENISIGLAWGQAIGRRVY